MELYLKSDTFTLYRAGTDDIVIEVVDGRVTHIEKKIPKMLEVEIDLEAEGSDDDGEEVTDDASNKEEGEEGTQAEEERPDRKGGHSDSETDREDHQRQVKRIAASGTRHSPTAFYSERDNKEAGQRTSLHTHGSAVDIRAARKQVIAKKLGL